MSVHRIQNKNSVTWRVKWRDDYGRQYTAHYKRKGDADDHDRKIKLGLVEKEKPQTRLTFADFAERWLRDYADVHHELGTKINVEGYIHNWFLPAFGKKYISDLQPQDFVKLQRKIHVEEDKAEKTANNIILAAKKMLNDAVEWRLITKNPVEGVKLLKVQRKEKKAWTRVEAERFLTYCKSRNPELYEAVLLTIRTGMRRGELKALKRDAVDFERRLILIKRTYCEKAKEPKDYTKSKDIRYVPMTEDVAEILKDRKLLSVDQNMLGFDVMSVVRKPYARMIKLTKVTKLTWHQLRDTYASQLSEAGAPPRQIQRLMGHSDVKTTEGYMHLNPAFMVGIAEALKTGVYNPLLVSKAESEAKSDVPFLFRLPDQSAAGVQG